MALLEWISTTRLTKSKRRRRVSAAKLLRPHEFERAAACERMRTDRNHSPLSILMFTFADDDAALPKSIEHLSKILSERLRMTDTAGRLRDGRVAVLLPDTPQSGAWKVASDVCEQYGAGPAQPRCEVLIYPDPGPDDLSRLDDPHDDSGQQADKSVLSKTVAESFFVRTSPVWKRAVDILGASIGLLLAGPVIAVVASAVALTSRGGAFFVQEREGQGGRRFKIYKIRTMTQGAHLVKDELRSQSEQDGPAFKMTNDPRVTWIGAFLRKTSIDELPQLINVLRGDMSLVGPRPLQLDESLACESWQRRRLAIKPGLTCIWQVKGRNTVSFDDWVRMDLEYAKQAGWWTDTKLILQTPSAILLSRGPR